MKKKNNFVSIVVLGNFNPSILTDEFLRKECGVNIPKKPKSVRSPIVSAVQYENLSFIVELDKLQVIDKQIKDFKDTPIINYAKRYLNILKYTPVFVAGVNFNRTIFFDNLDGIEELFVGKKEILKRILKTKEFVMEVKKRYTKVGEEHIRWHITYLVKEKTLTSLAVQREREAYVFNYNYEVRELDKEETLLGKLTDGYSFVLRRYEQVIGSILKEVKNANARVNYEH